MEKLENKTLQKVLYWRKQIYEILAFSAAVFGFFAYVPSVFLAHQEKLNFVILVNSLSYLIILGLLIFKKVPFLLRVYAFLFVVYILGISLLIFTGPYGAGFLWLFGFPVIGAVFLNKRQTLASISLCFATLFFIGLLKSGGYFEGLGIAFYSNSVWLVNSINFICLSLLTVLPLCHLVEGLKTSLLHEQRSEVSLREEKKNLFEAKQRAEELNRLKSSFLANMSHELRTPVNGVLGLVDIIDEEILNPTLQTYTQMIRQSADRLLSTISSILEISKSEAEGKQIVLSEIKPDEILTQSFPVFKILTDKNGLQFDQKLSFENPTLLLDENIYYQIINNLFGNAVKFTKTGRISIETRVVIKEDGKYYHCTKVEDTGIGMDLHFQKKIFIPFEQESQGYCRKYGGSGLGLAIVKKYTELFGGSIQFKSEKNRGSIFEVFFPCTGDIEIQEASYET